MALSSDTFSNFCLIISMSEGSNLSLFAAIHAVNVAFICFHLSLCPSFVSLHKNRASPRSMLPCNDQTQNEDMKNLSSCLTRGRSNCLDRNTKRGKTLARSLCQVPSILKFSNVSRDDRFAAQIDFATGRCPPMVRSMYCIGSLHFGFRLKRK